MTFVITQPCVDVRDQSCVEVCPVDCIQFEEGSDRMLYIDPTTCIDCGACEPACPVTAIFAEGDVPADQSHFTEINSLWFDDRAAARARLGGDAAPAAAPAAAEAAAPAAEAEAAEAAGATEEAPAGAAPAASAEAPAAAAEPEPVPEMVVAASGAQVEASEMLAHPEGVVASQYRLPSPLSLIGFAGLAFSLVFIWLAPGPNFGLPDLDILKNLEGPSKAGTALGVPLAVLFLGLFLLGEGRVMRTFAAHRDLPADPWRESRPIWRRSEESRRYELERAVQEVARDRFAFPSERHPEYQTHVNLPHPTLALEFTAGGASAAKVFPDIIVTAKPGDRPVMVAQVETRETVTRKQAQLVWAPLETQEAPLYLYVPSGLAGQARDYARAAGIQHVRIRTWRRQPTGIQVAEVS